MGREELRVESRDGGLGVRLARSCFVDVERGMRLVFALLWLCTSMLLKMIHTAKFAIPLLTVSLYC